MSQARIQRVAEQIKKEISVIIRDELHDPRVGFITITKVELTPDLHLAKVFFSFLGTKKQLGDTQIGLARSSGYVRKLLGQRIKIRYTPQVLFKLDEGAEHSIHIAQILDEIEKKKESNGRKESN